MQNPTTEPSATTMPETAEQPGFVEAVLADARVASAFMGQEDKFNSPLGTVMQILRLMLVTDSFLGQVAYRLEVGLRSRGVPVLPWIAHKVAMGTAQIAISSAAVLRPGVFITNGQLVVQGYVVIQAGAILSPWITLAAAPPDPVGPMIGPRAKIGTGAKVMGRVVIGRDARVAPNSLVLTDVEPDTTVVGTPAKAVTD
jgi:serine O-acetyltransferase